MKITDKNIEHHIGDVVKVENTGDIPNDTYLIMDVTTDGVILYSIKKEEIYNTELSLDYEFTQIYTPLEERIELAYESHVKLAMILLSQGWIYSENPDDIIDDKNIKPLLQKIKILKMLKDGALDEFEMGYNG